MNFPIADWQFWTVTVGAAGAVWMLVRPFVGRTGGGRAAGSCSQCGAAAGAPCQGGSRSDRLVSLGKAR
jgi:hypothetical protein